MGLSHQFLLLSPNSSRILNPIIIAKGKLKERAKADFRLAFCAEMISVISWDTGFIRKHLSHIKKLWELTVTVRNFRVVISTASFSACAAQDSLQGAVRQTGPNTLLSCPQLRLQNKTSPWQITNHAGAPKHTRSTRGERKKSSQLHKVVNEDSLDI